MAAPPMVPPLREGLLMAETKGGSSLVEDPVQRLRLPVDRLTMRIMDVLTEGPLDPDGLVTRLGASRVEVRRRVALLNRYALLSTPRGARQEALHGQAHALWSSDALQEAPLRYPEGLAHGCVACGACCTGTDVGPLRSEDIRRVESVDWRPHLPEDVDREDWLQSVELPSGDAITLMGQRQGRCVFLGEDKLCVIHRVAGPEMKPTICRQFPYTFTRTPEGVDVSFSMECRSWWQARQIGRPVSEDTEALRALLAEGAPVMDLPSPIPVWEGLDWSVNAWMDHRRKALEALDQAQSLAELSEAFITPVLDAVGGEVTAQRATEGFLSREAWRIPDGSGDSSDVIGQFRASADRLSGGLVEGLSSLADRYRDHGDHGQSDRHRRLVWAIEAALGGQDLSDMDRDPDEVSIWRDMIKASLYSHETARRGGLLAGTAELSFRLIVGQSMAAMLARAALRARTNTRDVVDSMVLVTKMLRGSLVADLLRRSRRDLIHVTLINAPVFSRGVAPVGAILEPLVPQHDSQ